MRRGVELMVDKGPIIAVVITCFNYETYVGRAIESVVCQKFSDYELIVVDDGSTDGSWDVIEKTGVIAYRIANIGQQSACLYGFDKTSAPFVLFLDADDELLPGTLEKIIQVLDPGVAKLQFCLTCVDAAGQVIADRYPALEAFRSQDKVVEEILQSGVYQTPPTSGNVFRRDVCELLRHCAYDSAVDGIILLAAPFMGDIISLPDSLGIYRVHGQNNSGLGCTPNAEIFERDLRRFQLRLVHLRQIVHRLRPDANMIKAEDTYYFKFTHFSACIARGSGYTLRSFLLLLRSVLTEPRPIKWKFFNSLLLVVLFLAPNHLGQALLARRFSVKPRFVRRLIKM